MTDISFQTPSAPLWLLNWFLYCCRHKALRFRLCQWVYVGHIMNHR